MPTLFDSEKATFSFRPWVNLSRHWSNRSIASVLDAASWFSDDGKLCNFEEGSPSRGRIGRLRIGAQEPASSYEQNTSEDAALPDAVKLILNLHVCWRCAFDIFGQSKFQFSWKFHVVQRLQLLGNSESYVFSWRFGICNVARDFGTSLYLLYRLPRRR